MFGLPQTIWNADNVDNCPTKLMGNTEKPHSAVLNYLLYFEEGGISFSHTEQDYSLKQQRISQMVPHTEPQEKKSLIKLLQCKLNQYLR